MTTNDIIFSVLPGLGGDIGKILLNRPQYLNSLTFEMCQLLKMQLEKWAEEDSIKAVVIAGSGQKAFCAGGDIVSIYKICHQQKNYTKALEFFQTEYAMNSIIFNFPKPYISLLDGITMGGGVGLSIHGSHSIATERLIWAMPETGIGFFPDVGVGYHLSKLSHHVGNYLTLLGEKIHAGDACRLNIVNAIVLSERLNELESKLIHSDFSADNFDAVTNIIAEFQVPSDSPLKMDLDNIAHTFNGRSLEEIVITLQQFPQAWGIETLEKLLLKSPLSLKVTHEHLMHCRQLEFSGVMQENLLLANKFIQTHDFMEGIRAAVIDKDRNPLWQPASLADIDRKMLDDFFSLPRPA